MRRPLLLLLALLLPTSGWAQGVRRSDIVLGPRGTPVPSVTVAVCTQPANTSTTPCSPLAALTIDSIAAISRTSNNVTVTTSSSHALVVGFTVTIAGVSDVSFNGTFAIGSVPSPTTFTYAQTAPNGSSSGGTVSQPNPLTGDVQGNYYFYAPAGRYTVQVYSPQIQSPFVQTDVLLPCDPSSPGATGCGTVASVGLSAPTQFTVTGSPITGSGTLTLGWANALANVVLAGPTSGAAAAPTFRALVPADYPVFGASGASHSAGAVPDPGATAGTTRFLREDATFQVPPTFGASGASHSVGYVPDPGATAGTTRFLREDASWAAAGGISIVAANQTAQQANIALTTLVTPGANGFFRISCYLVITQAATTSSTLPNCTINYTDADSNTAESVFATPTTSANAVGTVGGVQSGILTAPVFFAKSGVAIQYSTLNYASSGATPMQYAIHIRLEGPF